jgi:hypothetical protein
MEWSRYLLILLVFLAGVRVQGAEPDLQAGFAEEDITPQLGTHSVYLAGFGFNRKASAIHDPLLARVLVLRHGADRIALVSVDLVGLFHENVERIRGELKDFRYVLISSTHVHSGPDTLGIWGPNLFQSGVDPAYMKRVEKAIVRSIQQADRSCQPVKSHIGSVAVPELLRDSREPYIKHDELVALRFLDAKGKLAGIVVQWNCHPETLGGKNTQISADFVGVTVASLRKKYSCPVLYLTGTVGGLMTTLGVKVRDPKGNELPEGSFAQMERLGELLAEAAEQALNKSRPVRLTPWQVRKRDMFLPMDNKIYELARRMGVLRRQAYRWTGNPDKAEPANPAETKKRLCIRTEVGYLRLGQLSLAAVPGEIYPELVLGKVQNPADPGADYPDAPVEPALYKQMPGPYRMIVGLANDEVGYIIPKRQWDEKRPYCYGRARSQYGERNSLGPQTAPLLCEAFRDLVK